MEQCQKRNMKSHTRTLRLIQFRLKRVGRLMVCGIKVKIWDEQQSTSTSFWSKVKWIYNKKHNTITNVEITKSETW